MSRPGLGGFTYSPQYSMTMIEWLEERNRRKKARDSATKKDDESPEAFEARVNAMPRPRSWSDYMLDPLDDGVLLLNNPTEDQNERFFGIDPNAEINQDALVTQPWWPSRMKSGRAFSSRPVSLSVQKKLCSALPFSSPLTKLALNGCSRSDSII